MSNRWVLGLLLTSLLVAAGCTSQQRYASGQAYQRNQCQKSPDSVDRAQCLEGASIPYEQYQSELGSDGRR